MKIFNLLKVILFLAIPLQAHAQPGEEIEGIASYRLKPGDTVNLTVFREDDLEKKVTLTHTGGAAFRFIGTLQLAGLSLEEARQKITAAYDDGWLVEPEVTLDLVSASDETVTVMGAVAKPDTFVIPQGEGLGLDLTSALAQAGGLNSSADPAKITVKRGGRQETYHYASITSATAQPIKLIHGDIIDVGINPNIGTVVQVIGEVKTPGPVAYQPNLDVQVALGNRGGPTENASRGGYTIKRGGSTIQASLNTKMKPGDVLNIPTNGLVGKFVTITGEVNRPSNVPFSLDGGMSVLDALTKAGGVKETGNLSKANLLRNGKASRINIADMKTGKAAMLMLQPGDSVDVPQRRW